MRSPLSFRNRARRMQPRTSPLRPSLLLLGVVIGIILGAVYGFWIDPVKITDALPSALRAEAKDQYVMLVASAYMQDRNLDRAKQRLAPLGDAARAVITTAQKLVAQGKDPGALVTLATILTGAAVPTTQATAITAASPVKPPTPTSRVTPSPTVALTSAATSSLIPSADFKLITNEKYCNDVERKPLIIVDTIDENSKPLAAVRVTIKWADGQDGFVTGLKPEISTSYGDFLMQVGTTYSVQVGSRTPPVTGISTSTCVSSRSIPYPGATRLVFKREK